MPNRFSAPLASALLAFLLTLLSVYRPFSAPDCWTPMHVLHLELSAPKPLTIKMRPSTEAGLMNGFTKDFQAGGTGAIEKIDLPLPNVELSGMGLLWKSGAGPLRLHYACVKTLDGRTVREIPFELCTYRGPKKDIEWPLISVRPEMVFEQPFFSARFPDLAAVDPHPVSRKRAVLTFVFSFAGLFACARLLASARARWRSIPAHIAVFCGGRPRAAIAISGLLAVVFACFPVIFFGKSFVSPNNGMQMIYNANPTIAGAPLELAENSSGVDFGASLYQNVPNTAAQHRSVFMDREFPFWNRGPVLGDTQLGQLQSMVGDPLHWLPIATGSSAWAWDVKFVLARFAFAIGIGFLVWAACRHVGVSILFAVSAPFIGFFAYRGCHPAVFTICYAPWILVAWLEASRAASWRPACRWAALLLFADWWTLCSGTAKEASAMLLCLNLAGGLAMLLQAQPWRERASKLLVMAWVSILFVLIAAPQWLVFVDTLKKSYTIYDALPACQIQPSLIIGLFDDIFYRQLCGFDFVFNPSANLLVLAGVAWLFVRARDAFRNRIVLGISIVAILAASLAFGVIPPTLLKSIPFLATIYHFDNTFSCVLVILLFPLAALGVKRCIEGIAKPGWWSDWALTLGATSLLVMAFFGFMHASHRVGFNPLPEHLQLPVSRFFVLLVPLLLAAFTVFAPALRASLIRGPWRATGIVMLIAALAMIHFRHGQWLVTSFDRLAFNPKTRFDLRETQSPALAWLAAAQAKEPGRVTGIGDAMIPGVAGMYGLEEISGPDALKVAEAWHLIEALKLPIIWDWRVFIPPRMVRDFRSRLDFLNVRHYVMEKNPTIDPPEGVPVVFSDDMMVYESPTAWPRAFFTDAAFPATGLHEVSKLVHSGDGKPFAAVAPKIIERLQIPNAALAKRTTIAARGYRLTANSTEFAIEAPTRGLAVLHEAYSPGDIEVTVNGEPSVAIRVNGAFRAVPILTPGTHVVRFTYVPAVWGLSLGLCMGGLGLLAVSALLFIRNGRPAGTGAANSIGTNHVSNNPIPATCPAGS